MKKRYFCATLAVLLMMSLLVFPVSAEEYSGTCGDNATWTFDPDTGTLTYSGTGAIHGLPGDSSEGWRAYKSQIRHVVFEEGITAIEWGFEWIMRMQTLKIADSVKTIGDMAFTECNDLHTLDLGQGVTSIGSMAFSGAYSLDTVVLPTSLQNITGEAFSCGGLKTLALPEGMTTVNRAAFRSNEQMTKLYLPASVTKVDYAAFRGCSGLTDVYYGGTQAQWEAVEINNVNDDPYRGNNEYLLAATIHYEHSHSFDGGTVTRQANCAQKGVKTYTCTVCNAAKQETFSAGHKWDSGKVTPASCTENGKTVYTCTVCKDTREEKITAPGHSWDSGTQNADNTVTYACTKCSAKKTEGTPVTPTEPTVETTTPTVTDPTEGTSAVPETTSPAVTVPNTDATEPKQKEPAPAIPKKTFPWGIVIGVAAAVAVGGIATAVVLKKRKK